MHTQKISGEPIDLSFCTDIYQLHAEISNDKDLDTFGLLKEKEQNKIILSSYNRIDFAEIYMFFDYDGHAPLAHDEKIKELLALFNEETSFGKLYVSYPMVEALKHISDSIDFKNLKVEAKVKIGYKQIINQDIDNKYKDLTLYTKQIWILIIELHLKKMNHIVNEDYSLPKSNIQQGEIFLNQLKKYIAIDATVAVVSSFPIFLFDYYGFEFISKLLSNK